MVPTINSKRGGEMVLGTFRNYQDKICFGNNRPTYFLCRAILVKDRKGAILNYISKTDIFKNLFRKEIPPAPDGLL